MIINLAQSHLHDLFKGELELYLMSQFPNFRLSIIPNKRIIKVKGVKIPKDTPNVIDRILEYCKKNDNAIMSLRKFLPSYKRNEDLIIRKMKRKGLDSWFLAEDIKKKNGKDTE
jgi:hypothetical protein